ncbi:S8 family serine peptidase [Paenibacillus glycinis]|uniref:S8 family serine peptidase n=1 Tax=Paenibacillus glycinis TaxID=2697035 RepID=A0ABW9Y070_9BACL|nr:S8 family serine peptidase [Paenibacillus glycinis]NBD28365.1 S8 family serine peptidase [Paenibacillus glycinis]
MKSKLKKTSLAVAASLLLASGVAKPTFAEAMATDPQQSQVDQGAAPITAPFAADHVIVKFKAGAHAASALSAEMVVQDHPLPGTGAHVMTVQTGTDIPALVDALKQDPNVLYAEPDYQIVLPAKPVDSGNSPQPQAVDSLPAAGITAASEGKEQQAGADNVPASPDNSPASSEVPDRIPSDPWFRDQWALSNIGQPILEYFPSGTPGIDIEALNAWKITQGSDDAVIAILNSGVDTNLRDLAGNVWTNPDEIPDNGIDDDGDGYTDDLHGWDFAHGDNSLLDVTDHGIDRLGTNMASVIAGKLDNGIGGAGIAPNVKVMPLKIVAPDLGSASTLIDAIHYAKDKGVKLAVFGVSLNGYSQALKDAMADSGILFVVPAGNDGTNIDLPFANVYPAQYHLNNMVTVAAIDNNGMLPWYSNYGKDTVDVVAPGENIVVADPEVQFGYSAEMDNGYSKAILNGFGFEQLKEDEDTGCGFLCFKTSSAEPELQDVTERQDAFNRTMSYLGSGPASKVLLVQDDFYGNTGNTTKTDQDLATYKKLLEQFGYQQDAETGPSYHVRALASDADGPSLEEMQAYDIVVWFSGTDWLDDPAYKVITDNDQVNLTAYLGDSSRPRRLLLAGTNITSNINESEFMRNTLHMYVIGEGVLGDAVGVSGTAYDGVTYKMPDNSLASVDELVSLDPSTATVDLEIPFNADITSGSEMAAGYTAGVAALVLSRNPSMDAQAIKERIINSGTSSSSLQGLIKSGKMINAYRAMSDDEIPGTPFPGTLVNDSLDASGDAHDVFAIDVHAGEKLSVGLTGGKETDFDLRLFKPEATTVQGEANLAAVSETRATSDESIIYAIAQSGTYYIDVPAIAGAGSYALHIDRGNGPGEYEDASGAIVFDGAWTTVTQAELSGGTAKQLAAEGSAEFGFTGNRIEWRGTTGPDQGIANVYVDDVLVASPSLYSAAPSPRQSVILNQPVLDGHHVLRIEWTGDKDEKAQGSAINLDTIVVTNVVQENDPVVKFRGPWFTSYSVNHFGGMAKYANGTNNEVEVTFTGSRFMLLFTKSPNRGKVNVYIDGSPVPATAEPIDLYSKTTEYRVPVSFPNAMTLGEHTIRIENSGSKNELSSGTSMSFDALVVTQ